MRGLSSNLYTHAVSEYHASNCDTPRFVLCPPIELLCPPFPSFVRLDCRLVRCRRLGFLYFRVVQICPVELCPSCLFEVSRPPLGNLPSILLSMLFLSIAERLGTSSFCEILAPLLLIVLHLLLGGLLVSDPMLVGVGLVNQCMLRLLLVNARDPYRQRTYNM